MSPKRFTTSAQHDFTITQKVRTVLMEGGHYDLVAEQLVDGLRDVETMARQGISSLERRVKILEDAERDRLTDTGVKRIIRAERANSLADWTRWTIKKVLPWIGAAAGGAVLYKLGLKVMT